MPEQKPNTGASRLPMDLSSLEFLLCDMDSADAFSELYERMLNDAKMRRDLVRISKMRKILLKQTAFLIREHMKAGGRYAFEYHEGPEPKAEAETVQ